MEACCEYCTVFRHAPWIFAVRIARHRAQWPRGERDRRFVHLSVHFIRGGEVAAAEFPRAEFASLNKNGGATPRRDATRRDAANGRAARGDSADGLCRRSPCPTSPRFACTPPGRAPTVDERSLGSPWTEPSRTESAEWSVVLPRIARLLVGLLSKSAAIADSSVLLLFSLFSFAMKVVASAISLCRRVLS